MPGWHTEELLTAYTWAVQIRYMDCHVWSGAGLSSFFLAANVMCVVLVVYMWCCMCMMIYVWCSIHAIICHVVDVLCICVVCVVVYMYVCGDV